MQKSFVKEFKLYCKKKNLEVNFSIFFELWKEFSPEF